MIGSPLKTLHQERMRRKGRVSNKAYMGAFDFLPIFINFGDTNFFKRWGSIEQVVSKILAAKSRGKF